MNFKLVIRYLSPEIANDNSILGTRYNNLFVCLVGFFMVNLITEGGRDSILGTRF